jgi:hypothetical protein
MKTTRATKPITTDSYGNSFYSLSKSELVSLFESMQIERHKNWFWKESVTYRKKHTATMQLLSNLINS